MACYVEQVRALAKTERVGEAEIGGTASAVLSQLMSPASSDQGDEDLPYLRALAGVLFAANERTAGSEAPVCLKGWHCSNLRYSLRSP